MVFHAKSVTLFYFGLYKYIQLSRIYRLGYCCTQVTDDRMTVDRYSRVVDNRAGVPTAILNLYSTEVNFLYSIVKCEYLRMWYY